MMTMARDDGNGNEKMMAMIMRDDNSGNDGDGVMITTTMMKQIMTIMIAPGKFYNRMCMQP